MKYLRLSPEDVAATLDYYNRTHRGRVDVDSESAPARRMMFVSDTPGHYTGFGYYVVPNQHLSKNELQS